MTFGRAISWGARRNCSDMTAERLVSSHPALTAATESPMSRLPRLPVPGPRARLRALLGACALLCSLGAVAQSGVTQNPKLPQIDIQAGMHVIRAEVAGDSATRMRGLMEREQLGANEGMLFVFPDKAGHCFWMRNTPLPLSIAFIDDDGTIVNIADMQPRTDDSHCPLRAVRFALEMEQGWFARRGVKAGTRLGQPRLFGGAGVRQ
jgi:uncharacterized membrane protein (UPF0127 family)